MGDDGEAGVEWRRSGPYVGQWITRGVLNGASEVESFCVGRVVGYLSAAESGYTTEAGVAAALWRVDYVSGELAGDGEDLEEYDILESAPRPTRPDGTIQQVTDEGLKRGFDEKRQEADAAAAAKDDGGGDARGSKTEESDYERQRRERIEANQAFLQSLGFTGGDVGLPKDEKKKRGPRQKRGRAEPTRRSARVAKRRATHEKGQYNENRACRETMREKATDDLAEREKRREAPWPAALALNVELKAMLLCLGRLRDTSELAGVNEHTKFFEKYKPEVADRLCTVATAFRPAFRPDASCRDMRIEVLKAEDARDTLELAGVNQQINLFQKCHLPVAHGLCIAKLPAAPRTKTRDTSGRGS